MSNDELDLLCHNQEIWTDGYLGDCSTKEEYLKIYPGEIRPLGYLFPLCPNDSYQILGLTNNYEKIADWEYDTPMNKPTNEDWDREYEIEHKYFDARCRIIHNRAINILKEFIVGDSVLIDVSW